MKAPTSLFKFSAQTVVSATNVVVTFRVWVVLVQKPPYFVGSGLHSLTVTTQSLCVDKQLTRATQTLSKFTKSRGRWCKCLFEKTSPHVVFCISRLLSLHLKQTDKSAYITALKKKKRKEKGNAFICRPTGGSIRLPHSISSLHELAANGNREKTCNSVVCIWQLKAAN